MPQDVAAPARIGVLHLNQLGDLVFSLPALVALRSGFPRARIASVLRQELAPLLTSGSLVDEVITHQGTRDFLATAERLRSLCLDLTVSLSASPRSRLLGYLSGAPRRVGFDGGPLAGLLSERVEKLGPPSSANDLRLVRALGCPVARESYVGLLAARRQDRAAALALLERAGRPSGSDHLVVVAPAVSRGREEKQWPAERFAVLAGEVASTPGRSAVLVGADPPAESETGRHDGVLDLRGRTGLGELVGLLSLAELFVGNDSGVLHLAACLGVPCVGLYGPTDPAQTGPHGEDHVVLRSPDGDMASLTVDEVLAALRERGGRASGPVG